MLPTAAHHVTLSDAITSDTSGEVCLCSISILALYTVEIT